MKLDRMITILMLTAFVAVSSCGKHDMPKKEGGGEKTGEGSSTDPDAAKKAAEEAAKKAAEEAAKNAVVKRITIFIPEE